jgi:hypothetical protein
VTTSTLAAMAATGDDIDSGSEEYFRALFGIDMSPSSGLQDLDINIDFASPSWLRDDMDWMLQGLGDVGPGHDRISSTFPTIHAANRIVELDDEAASSVPLAETLQPGSKTEHLRAVLGLVGPPSLDKVAEQHSLALHPNAQQPPSTSGGSPWLVLTPSSSENGPSPNQPSSSGGLTPGEEPSPAPDPRLLLGPCSRVWVVPKVSLEVGFLTRHVRRLLTMACRKHARNGRRQTQSRRGLQRRSHHVGGAPSKIKRRVMRPP